MGVTELRIQSNVLSKYLERTRQLQMRINMQIENAPNIYLLIPEGEESLISALDQAGVMHLDDLQLQISLAIQAYDTLMHEVSEQIKIQAAEA